MRRVEFGAGERGPTTSYRPNCSIPLVGGPLVAAERYAFEISTVGREVGGMGQLVDGVWRRSDQFADDSGRFKRQDSVFRNWVTATGEAGPTGTGGFAGEACRYLLYVSLA